VLFEQVGTDQEFYKSLKRGDDGDAEADQGDIDNDDGVVCYDEIDSSKTVNEAIQDIIESAPADCLVDIYADKEGGLNESDAEDRGSGANLDIDTGNFSMRDATRRWMEWDGE